MTGVYIHPDHRGRGVGRALLAELIASSELAGIWTVQTGIFPENTASLALHQRCGFRIIGTRQRIGQLTVCGVTPSFSNAAARSWAEQTMSPSGPTRL